MTTCVYVQALESAGHADKPDELTQRAAGAIYGVGKSTVGDHRAGVCGCSDEADVETAPVTGRLELSSDGGSFTGIETTEPIRGDWSAVFARFNLDPAEFTIADDTVRMSSWQSSKRTDDGDRDIVWLYSYSARFVRKQAGSEQVNLPALYAAAKSATPASTPPYQERATVVVWADPQIGKTGSRGGTPELIARSTVIRKKLDQLLTDRNPSQILIADAGDGIEGFESGGNPMFTNDLSLSGQLDTYGTELFEYINLAHAHAPVTVAGIPSNHAAWRCGRQNLGKPADDLGLFMHKQVKRVTEATGMDVNWVQSTDYDESVSIDFYGTKVGLVHGNQFGPGQAVSWWQKQTFGGQAVASADILVFGHYHTFSASVAGRNPQSGKQRYCLGAPTLDNGSDWFRQVAGRDSDPGLLVFDVTPDGFDLSSLTILSA
jgi:hypothetical protein